jgi:hypothetical protein
MPPLDVSSSDVQRAVQEFKQIEKRVSDRMNSAANTAKTNNSSKSAVVRVAAMFGIKLPEDREIGK